MDFKTGVTITIQGEGYAKSGPRSKPRDQEFHLGAYPVAAILSNESAPYGPS